VRLLRSEVSPCGEVFRKLNFTLRITQNFTGETNFTALATSHKGVFMKDSELRTRAKSLALRVIAICDDIDTRKGRGVIRRMLVKSINTAKNKE